MPLPHERDSGRGDFDRVCAAKTIVHTMSVTHVDTYLHSVDLLNHNSRIPTSKYAEHEQPGKGRRRIRVAPHGAHYFIANELLFLTHNLIV